MTTDTDRHTPVDAIIVGGGVAGLSAAVALGRSRRSVAIIDAGDPRNAPAAHSHNYLTRDGESPLELVRLGRDEARHYGARIVEGVATSASRTEAGFEVTLADGSVVRGRRLLVTTGLTDVLPDIPGLADRWGRDVLHCPYCHGWEVRDRRIGIIGSAMVGHQAQMWRQLTEHVTVFAHTAPNSAEEDLERLAARGIEVVDGEIARVDVDGDAIVGVTLASGTQIPLDALVVGPNFTSRADVLLSLGLATTEMVMNDHVLGTYVEADPVGATSVPGVWVAGNVSAPMDTVVAASAAGVKAGAAINGDLIEEEVRIAVERAKAIAS
ncbi:MULTISPECIES: NAD(P)/FAD-dependent oxidoreductase [unclassified Rhodococcus (in: high G+C Gram-positive bacteria)]|uniref:NAD(P)/FAD-dependent oxidoreductase n=1 Tax=unclassified Rhodococcus (in: high G+C Gram-positive bacteria) TaxID=192944 RepID=UPI0007BBF897|nr:MULTISPECIES: NAD(P)/FAD-dependent oxidoreductase [unclassified Rhodococcus (in: high G+C Gram-positive bacteria)]KZF06736.1 thioredoxin reductase [Rhodococcus sp. EPR-147]KZF08589.1 thioredoxin reductase [Rhodococcus sp. EPR-279]OZE21085.1 NAD(P)/FAD-dependent oxidoreductase [Rhodococcus sp. 05-2254-6]OZE41982.1 NAD(P)/FAD-dependent oxidoreductase [Rhodococcus sp. 05-2254-4]OZE43447.1 NAD(P)/FAD-dependent oxidoreductase [Rhodococcus sp. 05-2254-3]